MERPKVYITLPAFGRVCDAETAVSLIQTAALLTHKGIGGKVNTFSLPDIVDLRNIITTIFYDLLPDFTHLLMVDADMSFAPELIVDMIEFDQPLVGVMYPKKTYPVMYVGKTLDGPQVVDRGFLKLQAVGAGVLLIKREVIEKMLHLKWATSDERQKLPVGRDVMNAIKLDRVIRCFDKIEGEKATLSEDYSFCHRWRQCGGDIWAATHHQITHIGPHTYAGRFADGMKSEAFEPSDKSESSKAA